MKERYLYILVLLITIACGTSRNTNNGTATETYNRRANVMNPEFVLFNKSDSISELHYKINSKELLFSRPDGINFTCDVLVSYILYGSYQSNDIIDSSSTRVVLTNNDNSEKNIIGNIGIKAPLSRKYLLRINIVDLNRGNSFSTITELDKLNKFNRQDYIVKSSNGEEPLFRTYFRPNEELQINYKKKTSSSLYVKYYKRHFPFPTPAFSSTSYQTFQYKADSAFTIRLDENGKTRFTANKKGFYHFQIDTTNKAGLTLYCFSEVYPEVRRPEDLVPPLRYISSNEEFESLSKNSNPKKAIGDFWLNTTGSQERAREMIRKYYNRVENANIFFTSYTEGWKTDRGMFYIIFGPPELIQHTEFNEIWTYTLGSDMGEQNFYFTKAENPFTNNDYILERSAAYKEGWEVAVDQWRQGKIILPD